MLSVAFMWTRRRIRIFSITFIAVMAASFLALRLTAVNGIDYCGSSLFPDFGQVYVAGQQILHGHGDALYDRDFIYRETNRVLNASDEAGFYPVYPPITAVLAAPWALLPYREAAWTHAILTLFVACYLARDMARWFFGKSDDATIATLLFLGFLPLWRVWMFGQNSVWALLILWGAWRLWTSDAGFKSGLLLSLGLFKPQLFVGAWLWAILWGNRRLRSGLILGLTTCVALGMICGGYTIWTQWFNAILNTTAFLEHIEWMTSLPHAWKLMGGERILGTAWIYVVLAIGGLAWGLALLQMKRKNASPNFALCLAMLGSWVLTPRLYVYDWILAWPLLLAAWKYGTQRMQNVIALGGLLFWVHDLFGMLHIPILALAGVAAFVWLLHRSYTQSASAC
jgi:hypothetical protein